MTKDELYIKMSVLCLERAQNSGWWIFNKKKITFKKTEVIEEFNIQIIQQLPEKISFPKNTAEVVINEYGIKNHSIFYSWSDIVATGVKCEAIPMEFMDDYKISLLLGFENGKIIEVEIKNNIDYASQVGHMVELYKFKFRKLNESATEQQ